MLKLLVDILLSKSSWAILDLCMVCYTIHVHSVASMVLLFIGFFEFGVVHFEWC